MIEQILVLMTLSSLLACTFVEGSRWSWNENHEISFEQVNGTMITVTELKAFHGDALKIFSKRLPLEEDRHVAELIIKNPEIFVEAVAHYYPPELDVCHDFIEEDVEYDCDGPSGSTISCTICATEFPELGEEGYWQDVWEDMMVDAFIEQSRMGE